MGEHARTLAMLVIEEIDNQLRRLTQEKDETTSPSIQDELEKSIQRRLRERIAWERLLEPAADRARDDRWGERTIIVQERKLAS